MVMEMKGKNGSKTVMLSTIFALIFLISSSTILISAVGDTSPPSRAPIRVDISTIVEYHSATNGDQDLTGEACLQMAFDAHLNGYDGPSVDQQDIRNVTKGRLGSGVAELDELRLAAHYSQEAIVGERGYEERYYGYGSTKYDWTNWPLEMSPRHGVRFTDLKESLAMGLPVIVYQYLDIPPTYNPDPPDTPNPDDPPTEPPQPQVTLEDLAALEKVWRIVVGYDSGIGQFRVHDPLPKGTGYLGGDKRWISQGNFDKLWNITERDNDGLKTHRYGLIVAPWSMDIYINEKLREKDIQVEAGTRFQLSANITYRLPSFLEGTPVSEARADLDLPDEFSVVNSPTSRSIDIIGPGDWNMITWTVETPERSYVGQDIQFHVNASGLISGEGPTNRDRVGRSAMFNVPVYGFLNHPPVVSSGKVDPAQIPDDGSIQPLISCKVVDEDGNLRANGVTADLSELIGSSYTKQVLYDDGTHGDAVKEDGTYTYMITQAPRPGSVGEKVLRITALDSRNAKGYSNVTIVVRSVYDWTEEPEFVRAGVSPRGVPNDGFTEAVIWARVDDVEGDLDKVEADLTPIGGENRQRLYDDGTSGDVFSDDGNWSFAFTVSPITPLGDLQVELTAYDHAGHEVNERVLIKVIMPPVAPIIKEVQLEPTTVVNDGKDVCELTALVEDVNGDLLQVYVDLSRVDGSSRASMYDDGTHGDLRSGDDIWTITFTVPSSVYTGNKKLDITAEDAEGLTGENSATLYIDQANLPPEIDEWELSATSVSPGTRIDVFVNVSDPEGFIQEVVIILTELDGSTVDLLDDGEGADVTADDMLFSGFFTVLDGTPAGTYNLTLEVTDAGGKKVSNRISITVVEPEVKETLPVDEMIYVAAPVGAIILLIVLAFFLSKRKGGAPVARPMVVTAQVSRASPPRF